MNFMRTATALLFLVLGETGCEQMVTINGRVSVSLDVQKAFTRERPGRVVVWWGSGSGATNLFALCGNENPMLVFPFRITTPGCAKEANVVAVADLVPESLVKDVQCDQKGGPTGQIMRETAIAWAESVVFSGKKGGSCESGEATVELILEAK